MKLALFTPGAYIWPVERSFEAFIHTLGGSATDADDVVASTVYPAGSLDDPQAAMPAELSARLIQLHRDLYDALLRPAQFFAGESRTQFIDYFCPDLKGTQVESLINALIFYFTGNTGPEATVPMGLSVLRAVFFNHEAADPEIWLHSAAKRLAPLSNNRPTAKTTFTAPRDARVQGLSCAIVGARYLPPASPRMIVANSRRGLDGAIEVTVEYGADPSLAESPAQAEAARRLAIDTVRTVFGWQEVQAA